VAELRQYGVCAVEQPVFCGAAELADLARGCELPLIADESLIAPRDLAPLLAAGGKVWLNIRLSKNGGLAACAGMATRAAQAGVPYVIGAMVGESSILSAAQRCLLSRIPAPRFVEGNYGRFLLGADLTTKSIRFGYGGKLKSLPGPGLGGNVSDQLVKRHGTLVRHMG
jgi:L-alanine-DL-glutamate epimerase-like enolase superfamily enzyme